ncbi:MAG: protein phosphatase 2C domain-containing protein [Bacteroidota bacterium]
MQIYSLLQRGEFHTNYCEDFLVVEPISKDEILIAVLDGCTMGKESFFASALYGKILRKIAKKWYYLDFIETDLEKPVSIKIIMKELMEEAIKTKNLLGLEKEEMLSTLILGLVNQKTKSAKFITIGDGLISIDGILKEYEQNNIPDYLGYHLSEDFEDFFESQQQKLEVDHFKNLSISTDGIFTFQNNSKKKKVVENDPIIHYLLEDDEYSDNSNMLERKMRILQLDKDLTVTDDLAIVRVIQI